ncbi:uncharacterized protein LACBIDRAFT_328778 [Laccaria bicolor S238N-H82]|uniref:Predicted protein n=1 Tax=Laccaria bicolor (strain S238N-H82 / ATCC MYA-4686) TaxID=486041 RepID=B0DFY5_LACBS|nr:uncharacterized protein LACBIDRAFT_328778 [Laccaria bicolor S238N-H82]EDR06543.1 predicted protein [Laccaria bicolor S238N-H82]|eukprot:XP_001882915.1 predicted protein [Laccaria bicolor S238N-H82]
MYKITPDGEGVEEVPVPASVRATGTIPDGYTVETCLGDASTGSGGLGPDGGEAGRSGESHRWGETEAAQQEEGERAAELDEQMVREDRRFVMAIQETTAHSKKDFSALSCINTVITLKAVRFGEFKEFARTKVTHSVAKMENDCPTHQLSSIKAWGMMWKIYEHPLRKVEQLYSIYTVIVSLFVIFGPADFGLKFPMANDTSDAAQLLVNKIFNAEDAEIAFRSSDNAIFKIHRKNLEVNSVGLSPADLTTSVSELVPLSEDAPTLELLFQYIYPRRQPLLDDIEFALLASLAEAAEKYEVFAAMTVCYIRMSAAKREHPEEIMRYAARHDYKLLLCDVAPLVIRMPLLDVLSFLPQHLMVPWISYYEEWRKVHAAAFPKAVSHKSEIKLTRKSGHSVWSDQCTDWPHIWQEITTQLGSGVHTLANIDSVLKTPKRVDNPFSGSTSPKDCCIDAVDQWRTSIKGDLRKIRSPVNRSFRDLGFFEFLGPFPANFGLKLPMSDDSDAAQALTMNKIFNAEDAEIAFRSSDNVVFKIHRKNLEVNTAGLSPADLATSVSEVVPLSEDSPTLELLFQYIYPRRQPLLDDIEFALLASLAEAAEKYEVFAAMTVCYLRMSMAQHKHPAEIMRYAARHDYIPLLCDVAPSVIRIPLLDVLSLLPQHLIMPWLEYYEEWRKAHAAAFSKALSHDSPEIVRKSNSGKTVYRDPCTDWPRLWQEIATQLGPGVHTLANIDSILKTPKRVDSLYGTSSPQNCCIDAIDEWCTSIKGDLGKIPRPSKFFN